MPASDISPITESDCTIGKAKSKNLISASDLSNLTIRPIPDLITLSTSTMRIEYNNLYTHFIFITLRREATILEVNRQRIEKYMTGIVNNNDSKLYAIYANPEHVHFLASRSPKLSEEDLATVVADSSEKFINKNKLSVGRFAWQQSAAAFSVSKADVNKVCKYILNQPYHHRKTTFSEEYDSFIKFYEKTLHVGGHTV